MQSSGNSNKLGSSCSRWNQCDNERQSWHVVLCIENTCVCNPYWGYGGENCAEPTRLILVQRCIFSLLFVATILYVILSLCYVKSYVLCSKGDSSQAKPSLNSFRRRKINSKGVAIVVNAFISAPSAFMIVLGGFSAVTFDPQMRILSTFEISYALGILGISIQSCSMGLAWIETALSIRRYVFLKRNWKKIKCAAYIYGALLSISVLVVQLARKSSSYQLAIALTSIMNLAVIVQVPIGLFGGLFLSSSMIECGIEGSDTYTEGKMIRKCALSMLISIVGYGLFAVFRSGVAGYGWFLAICNGLCVLFGLLFELCFLFYVDHSGFYFKAASRTNMYRARVHPISPIDRDPVGMKILNGHRIVAVKGSAGLFS